MVAVGAAVTEADPAKAITWREFRATRPDARLVGVCGEHLAHIVGPRAEVREVYVVEGTTSHYWGKHHAHLDMAHAEALLPGVLADPLFVCQGKKATTLNFVGEFDERHYLIAPIKALPGELWLQTLFIDEKAKFATRGWVKRGLLYEKR